MIKRLIVNILFIVLWTAMAVVLLVAGTLMCGVRILNPERLTPIVVNFANKVLDADVSAGRVELAFRPGFPVLQLSVDSLTVVSHALKASDRSGLPAYADTLFTIGAFRGAVDLQPLLTRGEIAVGDVALVRPSMNIVIDRHGKGNFDIYKSAEDTTDNGSLVIPPFSIRRFTFSDARQIRYFNEVDSTEATVVLLSRASLDGSGPPRYALNIDGRLDGPMARLLQLDGISFGMDGKVRWSPETYTMFAFEDFTLYGEFMRARASAALAYDSTLTVSAARVSVEPFALTDAMTMIPDDIAKDYRLRSPFFDTDALIGFEMELERPFCVAVDSIPYARIDMSIPKCRMRYGKADIRSLEFDGSLELRGNDLDSAGINIRRFAVSGPATTLDISAEATRLVSDPAFKANLKGHMNLRRLPPILTRLIPGSLRGSLNFKLDAKGRASMFTPARFHGLDVRGDLTGKNLYFLASDTAVMTEIDGLDIRFGSRLSRPDKKTSSPTLAAKISIDTATVLIDGISLTGSDMAIGMGVENRRPGADTTLVVPIGGGLKIGRLNILSVTDSAGVRLRNLLGRASVQRFQGHKRLPEISADLELGFVSAGNPSNRFTLRKAALHARTYKNPQKAAFREAVKRTADSISYAHPELSPDSVFKLAIAKRRHIPGTPRKRRVRTALSETENEVIEWDLAKGLKRYLLEWELEGELSTRNARLITPVFPIRNRMRRLDIAFNSDSVNLHGVQCRLGRTDLAIEGMITNIRRALTTKRTGNPLKLDFAIYSDTIDVNQLAAAAFAGSAYLERVRSGGARLSMSGDENDMERQLEASVEQKSDATAILIPTNVEANLAVDAATVLYDEFILNKLHGDVMLYDGAVNLHDLAATSDAGTVALSALYSAPKKTDIQFGLGLQLEDFRIDRFLRLVPAVDTIMPMIRDFSGIINADVAATVDVDSTMNMLLPTLDAAIRLSGDSLAFINPKTYATLGKWLRFRDRADNRIKHVSVEMLVRDNMLELFPFSFNIDRYRLGVLGHNDLAMNFDYHISVLKSPLPFKFGVTVKGNPDKYKVRFGGARFKDNMAAENVSIVDTARVSLVRQIENVFRRGVRNSRLGKLDAGTPVGTYADTMQALSHADSLALINEGIIEAPVPAEPVKEKRSFTDRLKNAFGGKNNKNATRRKDDGD